VKSLASSFPLKEFSFGVFNDPFMQVHCLRAIALPKKRNDELEGILQSIVSGTETKRNTGHSMLSEAVETICIVSKQPSLRGLAFNQIGRLLSSKDRNVLRSAISVFARIVYREHPVLSRGSANTMALQCDKSQIVRCLSHQDPSSFLLMPHISILHIFRFHISYFQNQSCINNVGYFAIMFHRIAGCIKRLSDLFMGMSVSKSACVDVYMCGCVNV
jgi:hypothetical protein